MRFERLRQRRRQRLGDRLIQPVTLFAQLANVGRHRPAIVVRPGKAADRRQSIVIAGNARAQRRHHLGRERAAVGHAVEQPLLVEAAHDDQPVDGIVGVLTDLAKAELAVAAAHGCGAEIDLRRQLVIDLDLGRAHRAAPFGRREIHVGELHGALELVAALRGEEYDRTVRVDAPLGRQMLGEEVDDLALILDHEGRRGSHAGAVRDRACGSSTARRARAGDIPAGRAGGTRHPARTRSARAVAGSPTSAAAAAPCRSRAGP